MKLCIIKKPFKCELCKQRFEKKHFDMYNFLKKGLKKTLKCILCNQKLEKNLFVCTICGEGFEKYVSGRTKVQSERNS